ncbi:biopolymer transporter ExbD [uncultured Methylophaga sp.]|uniref:ExbD/TolR family protein n=1 Tax=uncultured Methylophaga sp. TaxID=285271 RepID=UPI00261C62E2|nr:biopolymer transporter ExbD [uncultured Methylophaga sp.]
MAMNSGGSENMMSEINVTPLVDVMLVLLTIFIVTAPLLMNAVPLNLPKATADVAVTQPESVTISVTEDGSLFFDKEAVTAEALDTRLALAADNKEQIVEIFADERVEYGAVADVMAAIQRAGISNFTFVMQPEAEQ